jgi:hypothetical protein
MRFIPRSEEADVAYEPQTQVILGESDVQQLRETLPWLLRALANRPETPARYRERREKAHTLLERLLEALPPGVTPADGLVDRQ